MGVFHDLSLAFTVAEQIFFLKDGTAAACGSAEEILSAHLPREIYGIDVAAEMRERYKGWEEVPK